MINIEYERGRTAKGKVVADILFLTRESGSIWAHLDQVKPCIYHVHPMLHESLTTLLQDTDSNTNFVITNVCEAYEGLEEILYGYHLRVEFEPIDRCLFCGI